MNPGCLEVLRCLVCSHSPLKLDVGAGVGERVMEGWIYCPACQERWPVIAGVPRFVSNSGYTRSFGEEWSMFSRTQLDSYTGTTISLDRFRDVTQTEPSELTGKQVLECGCGMGRFIEVLAQAGAQVIGIDYSAAVDAAFSNLSSYPNVTIIQADLYNLPFVTGSFDFVYSIGVLHHTPDTRKALHAIARSVKPGGRLAVWVYRKYRLFRPYRLYRLLLRRLSAEKVLRLIRLYHPIPWFIRRVPIVGKPLSVFLPIVDYRGVLPLGEQFQREWSYLDTVDALTPWFEWRHSPDELKRWFEELGYEHIAVGNTPCSTTGQRPAAAEEALSRTTGACVA
jgi:SAM-dependent methyltransferase